MHCDRVRRPILIAVSVLGVLNALCRAGERNVVWYEAFELEGQPYDDKYPTTSYIATTFSPDGLLIAAGHRDGSVRIYDAQSGAALNSLSVHRSPIRALAFAQDATRLAVLSFRDEVKAYDVGGWSIAAAFNLQDRAPDKANFFRGVDLEFSGNPRFLMIEMQATSFLADLETDAATWSKEIERGDDQDRAVDAVLSGDGTMVVALRDSGGARVRETATGKLLLERPKPVSTRVKSERFYNSRNGSFIEFPRCGFSANGKLLALSCRQSVEVWNISDGKLVSLYDVGNLDEQQVTSVGWSPDSKRIVVAARKGAWPFVIDAESGRIALELEMPGDVDDAVGRFGMSYVSYSPDGRFIAAGRQGEDQFVTLPRENGPVFRYDIVWDARSGAIVGKIKGDYGIRPLFSPDSKSIVTMAPKPAVWRLRE